MASEHDLSLFKSYSRNYHIPSSTRRCQRQLLALQPIQQSTHHCGTIRSHIIIMMNRTQAVQVLQKAQTVSGEEKKEERVLVLRLQSRPAHRVSWTEDTIDNEGMNKKKSNLCCIYHRPGEESSDTCSSDDEGNALERDRHTKHLHKKKCSKLNKPQQTQ